jgi:O-antigen/teichoic acid export membrane protein
MNIAVIRGSFTLGAGDFSRKALLATTVLLCARLLPARTFGDYIFLLSFYQIFAVLGGAGLPSGLLRAAARSEQRGIHTGLASVLVRLVYIVPTATVMYIAMYVIRPSWPYFSALGLLLMMMIFRSATENIIFILQGYEDQRGCAKVGMSQSAVTLVATFVVCLTSKSLLLLIGAHVIGGFVSAVYGFALLRAKRMRNQDLATGIYAETRSLLKESHWLNAGAFVAAVYNRVDVLLLRWFLTAEAVAAYGAPYRILDLTQVIPASLVGTILPSLCRSRNGRAAATQTAMRFLFIIALCLIVMVTFGAPRMAYVLFGLNYEASIPVLQILIWATIPMFWNFVLNAQFIAKVFDRAILYGATVALLVNVVLNLLLIPKFGFLACAVITLVTELSLLLANLYFAAKIGVAAFPEHFGRLTLATFFVAGFCLCWTLGEPRYLFSIILLATGASVLPVFRSDFSRSRVAVTACNG